MSIFPNWPPANDDVGFRPALDWAIPADPNDNLKEMDEKVIRLEKEKNEAIDNSDFERAASLRDQIEQLRKNKGPKGPNNSSDS